MITYMKILFTLGGEVIERVLAGGGRGVIVVVGGGRVIVVGGRLYYGAFRE